MKSLVNYNGILTFLNSDPGKQSIKFEELLTKSDNIPTIIQFIQKKQLINVHYTNLSSCYFFQDLLKESKTLIINSNMIKLFKNCGNIILSQTTLVTMHKHFYISDYINNKLKYLFCGIENIEPFIVNCVSYDEIIEGSNNYNFNIFNEKKDIIINTLNWTWYGFEEWISFDTFLDEFLPDFTDIKNHYLYNKEINYSKSNLKMNSKLESNNTSKMSNNSTNNNNGKKMSRLNTNEKNNMKEKIEEIISVFNLNNECIIGNFFVIMKKGTFNLLKKIEKTLLININSNYDYETMLDLDKIKHLPIPKKMLLQLIQDHQERKDSLMKKNEEKKEKEILKIPNSFISEKNMEELFLPGNKIIHLQILSENLFKYLNNDKTSNYYHINNILNRNKLEDKNKNNIIIPKNQYDYQNLKDFFDVNKQFTSNLYDMEPIVVFIKYIQKIYRGYIIRKKFTNIYKYVRHYIVLLQKNMRGFVLRAKYYRFIDCLKKITFIQILYKNYFKRKINAIKLIQKSFRHFFQGKIAKFNKYRKTSKSKHNPIKNSNGIPSKKNSNSSFKKNKIALNTNDNIKNIIKNKNKLINRTTSHKINKQKEKNIKRFINKIQKNEDINDITKLLLNETNNRKIINTLLYNKNFMIDADKSFNTDYYRTIYKTKFVYPYLRTSKNKEPKLEDRLIQYGEDKKLKHLLNNFKFHEDECNKCSFRPKINEIYEFEDSFYERNLKFIQAKKLKLEYNRLKEDEIYRVACPFKPTINENKIKRTLDDLFKWQEKINKEKEEIKQLYEEYTEKQIQSLMNCKPKNNFYSNIKYLEQKAERMGKIEESKDSNINSKNSKSREMDTKSSNFSSNGYIDIGIPYDVWPIHLKKKFP
jgi:hypothetical protein